MSILIKNHGTTWIECIFDCGIDDFHTIVTEQGVKLILVNIEEHQNLHGFEIKHTPVTRESVAIYGLEE